MIEVGRLSASLNILELKMCTFQFSKQQHLFLRLDHILADAYSVYACLETMLYDIALNYSALLLGSKVLFATMMTHDSKNVHRTTNIFLSLRTQPYAVLPSILHSILKCWQSVDGGEIGKGIRNNRIRDENLES